MIPVRLLVPYEFTPVPSCGSVPERDFYPGTKLIPMSCKLGTTVTASNHSLGSLERVTHA